MPAATACDKTGDHESNVCHEFRICVSEAGVFGKAVDVDLATYLRYPDTANLLLVGEYADESGQIKTTHAINL